MDDVIVQDVIGEHLAPGIPDWTRDRARFGAYLADLLARHGCSPEGLPDHVVAREVRYALRTLAPDGQVVA